MIFPKIAALLAAYLGIFQMYLTLRVVKIRRRDKVALETANNDQLTRAVRSHANLVETTPIFLIILGFTESAGANVFAVLFLGLIFAISRTVHPIGLSGKKGTFKFRTYGMMGTLFPTVLTAALLIFHILFVM